MIGLLGDAVLALTCSAYNDGKVRTSQNLLVSLSLCTRDTLSLPKPFPIFIQLITTDYQVGTLRMTTRSHPPPNHEQTNVAKCPSIFFLDNYTYATTATTAATTASATGGAAAGGGASAVPVARHRVAIQTIVSSNRSATINSRATTSSATKAKSVCKFTPASIPTRRIREIYGSRK